MSEQVETLFQDISDRLNAMGESVSEERIKGLVNDSLAALLKDENRDFVRKMRFGANGDHKLEGSKFSRWKLTVGDVEFLYDLMQARKALNGPGPSEELEGAFKVITEAVYMPMEQVRAIDRKAIDDLFPRIPVREFPAWDRELAARGAWDKTTAYADAVRAMDTAESGYGSQLVGAQYVGELWQAARAESRVMALLNSFEMTDPTSYLPVEAALPEMLYVTESTANNASNYDTSKSGSNRVTVSAKKFLIHQMWSGEMDEDSIIPFVPFVRRQAMLALAHYGDSVVLNGDTTNAGTGNINLDDADPADTKHYLALDGIRHVGLADNTNNQIDAGGAITYDDLINVRAGMVDTTYLQDWGHPANPEDLVFVSDPFTGDKVALLDETLTIDKYGAASTVVKGEITKVGQHPFITSMAMSKTEADGKVSTTGSNNVKGQVAVFNKRGFVVGWRRRVKMEVERLPATDQTRIVHSLRLGLGRYSPTGAASGIEAASVIFDITV